MKRNLVGVIAAVLSLVLIGAGAVMIQQGFVAKADVKAALAAENITTPDDASIPGVPVDSAATALAQAEIIQKHTLEATEGRTWADMDREDPQRPFYLQAVTLRTSLMSAYMGFKVADLVTGLGALFLTVGLGGGVATTIALRSQKAASAVSTKSETRVPVNA